MTEELKPCPFCGSKDVSMTEYTNYRDYAFRGILCRECRMFCTTGRSDEYRVNTWNRRAEE